MLDEDQYGRPVLRSTLRWAIPFAIVAMLVSLGNVTQAFFCPNLRLPVTRYNELLSPLETYLAAGGKVLPNRCDDLPQAGDRLTAVDGTPVPTRSRLVVRLWHTSVGEPVELTFERAGQQLSCWVTLPPVPRGVLSSHIVLGLALLLLGTVGVIIRPDDPAAVKLFFFCWAASCASLFQWGQSPMFHSLLYAAFWAPSILTHLFLTFPVDRLASLSRLRARTVRAAIYAPGVLLSALALLEEWGLLRLDLLPYATFAEPYMIWASAVATAMLGITMFRVRDPAVRQQLKWILWGGMLAAIFYTLSFITPEELLPSSVGTLVLFAAPLGVMLAVARYSLFTDIDRLIGRTLIYSVSVLLLNLIYVGSVAFLAWHLHRPLLSDPLLLNLGLVLLSLAVFLDSLRRVLERRVLRVLAGQRPDYTQFLRAVGNDLIFARTPSDVVRDVVQRLHEIFRPRGIVAYLYNRRTQRYDLYARHGEARGPLSVHANGPITEQIRTQLPPEYATYIVNTSLHQTFPDAELCVPLWSNRQLRGWILLGPREDGRPYAQADLDTIHLACPQIAIALDGADAYLEAQQRAHQLSTLLEISRTLAASLNLDEILNLVVERVVSELEVEGSSILLIESEDLVFRAAAGVVGRRLIGQRMPISAGIAGQVARTGYPIIVNNVQDVGFWERQIDKRVGFSTYAVLCVPIRYRERVLGVIEAVNHKDGAPFIPEDQSLLEGIAASAAVAIESARLYAQTDEALHRRVEELSLLHKIDQQLNAELHLDRLASLTLSWALQLTGADAGLFWSPLAQQRILASDGYPASIDVEAVDRELEEVGGNISVPVLWDPGKGPGVYPQSRRLIAPIRREQDLLAVLLLEDTSGRFSQETVDQIARFADHAAIAVDNARLYTDLQEANKAKSDFVRLVAHELKSPMTTIKGYSELVQLTLGEKLSGEDANLLRTIVGAVENMQRLVEDLLELSRLETRSISIEPWPVELNALLGDVLRTLRPRLEAKKQSLELSIPDDLPRAYVDPVRISQVLTNLLTNAIKYTPEGGRIGVELARWGEGWLRCTVRDTGIGIAPEELDRIFERFYRSSDPLAQREKGTGLGLSIARMIVELHGGEIWVESALRQGSAFHFTVPIARE